MDSDANDLKAPGHVSTQDDDREEQDSNCNYNYVPSSQCDANSNNQNIYVGLANYHNVKANINKEKHMAQYSKISSENVSRGQSTQNVGKILDLTNARCFVPDNGFGDIDNSDDDDDANDNIKRGTTLRGIGPQLKSLRGCQTAFAEVLNSELNHSFDAKLKETNKYDVDKMKHIPKGHSQASSCKLQPGGNTLILDSVESRGSLEIPRSKEKNSVTRDFLKDSKKVNVDSENEEGRNEMDKETSTQASICLDSKDLYTTRGEDSQTCFENTDSKTDCKNLHGQDPSSEFVGASEGKYSTYNDGQSEHSSQDLNSVNIKEHEHNDSADNDKNLTKLNDVNSLKNVFHCKNDISNAKAESCAYVERPHDNFGQISDRKSEDPRRSPPPPPPPPPRTGGFPHTAASRDGGEGGDRSRVFPSRSRSGARATARESSAPCRDPEALRRARDACAEHRQLREESRARMRAHLIMYRRLMLLRLIRALRLKTLEQQSRLQCCYDVILDTRKEVLKTGVIDQCQTSV
uniref:UPF0500 protein C1orf216 homolog isoform X2 n=1 Tax=Petromyzon marinus TaxID=7757 RepID=A0AAJ7T579_PETMA|nr:UPF0500 protein C1orf216 homolog isoform X2 [Petromyzon marinus]